ncbi:MAG: hypothetical protein AB1450_03520 [Pseudomonadota bacterium]
MTRTTLMSLLPLSLPLSACTVEVGKAGTILLLVLLPAALVFALLWGLRARRQSRAAGREERRNYPDFDDKE